jgi:hypothetical protein
MYAGKGDRWLSPQPGQWELASKVYPGDSTAQLNRQYAREKTSPPHGCQHPEKNSSPTASGRVLLYRNDTITPHMTCNILEMLLVMLLCDSGVNDKNGPVGPHAQPTPVLHCCRKPSAHGMPAHWLYHSSSYSLTRLDGCAHKPAAPNCNPHTGCHVQEHTPRPSAQLESSLAQQPHPTMSHTGICARCAAPDGQTATHGDCHSSMGSCHSSDRMVGGKTAQLLTVL